MVGCRAQVGGGQMRAGVTDCQQDATAEEGSINIKQPV